MWDIISTTQYSYWYITTTISCMATFLQQIRKGGQTFLVQNSRDTFEKISWWMFWNLHPHQCNIYDTRIFVKNLYPSEFLGKNIFIIFNFRDGVIRFLSRGLGGLKWFPISVCANFAPLEMLWIILDPHSWSWRIIHVYMSYMYVYAW